MFARFKDSKFRDDQRGNATIEFVLLFPLIVTLFLMGFEAGYYMIRNTLLERAVDIAVRDVRIDNSSSIEYSDLKENICQETAVINGCVENLQIDLRPIVPEPGGVAAMGTTARCIDKGSTAPPESGTNYDTAGGNNVMILRACLLSKPLFPTSALGARMAVDGEGNYAIVVATAFVNEPENAAPAASPSGTYLPPAVPTPPPPPTPDPEPEPPTSDPGTPGGPGSPSGPGSPGTPGTPGSPGSPGTPTDPAPPSGGTGSNPPPTNDPGNPGTPSNPGSPSDPGSPGSPGTPSSPGTSTPPPPSIPDFGKPPPAR